LTGFRFASRDEPVALTVPGVGALGMFVHRDNDAYISPSLSRLGYWEPLETQLVLDTVGSGQTAVDVGANIGYYTLIMSRLVGPQGRVVAFEPEPANIALLRKNLELNGIRNVTVLEQAVADKCSRGHLYLSPDNLGDHRLLDAAGGRKSCPVDIVSLDGCPHLDGSAIHFVKIDTQGSELSVLDGMAGLIENNREALSVLMEFSPGLLARNGCDFEALLACFRRVGARPYWIGQRDKRVQVTAMGPRELRGLWSLISQAESEEYYTDLFVRFDRTRPVLPWSNDVEIAPRWMSTPPD
jgi:FkbM family methyltransferase